VVACHLSVSAYEGAPNAGDPPLSWLGLALGFGYLGVPLFFVVSGFCIHLPQARSRAAGSAAQPDWGRFFRRRLWRLYPPYLCSLALGALLLLVSTGGLPVAPPAILAQALLVHTFHPASFDGLNPPAWTLALEAQLYLAYPVVFWLVARHRPWRALALVLAITMLYRGLLLLEPFPARFGGVAWEFFLARWFEWTLGAVAAEWAVGSIALPHALRSPWLAAAALGGAVALEWHTWRFGVYALKEPLDGVAFALLLVAALDRERAGVAGAARSARSRWLAAVGAWSYSLYLVHRPIQLAFEPLARRLAESPFVLAHGVPSSLLLMAASTPVVLLAARALYRACEAPCIRRSQRVG
jgi:peptidoglycan/LPS O-acetylase OafA/YrhL